MYGCANSLPVCLSPSHAWLVFCEYVCPPPLPDVVNLSLSLSFASHSSTGNSKASWTDTWYFFSLNHSSSSLSPFQPISPLSLSFQLAARNGHPEVIRLLVEKGGADVQERNATTGWVALHEAAFRGHVDCVKVGCTCDYTSSPRGW